MYTCKSDDLYFNIELTLYFDIFLITLVIDLDRTFCDIEHMFIIHFILC